MFEKYFNNRFFLLFIFPFLIGFLTTLSFEPFNFTAINLIIFPSLFYLIVYVNKKSKYIYRKKPYKKNFFLIGLMFGFGIYLSGISWISNSLTFDQNFKILIPFALILLPLFLSLFNATIILIIGTYLKPNFSSFFLFSASLSFIDYLRSKILTGFPWNLWAYSTSWANEILQIVNLIGLHSYNLLVITFFTMPIVFFFQISSVKKILVFLATFATLLTLFIYGNFEINKNIKFLNQSNEKIYVKVISPNFELRYGLTLKEIEGRFKKLIRYSDPDKNKKTLFVWPEGVFSGYNFEEVKMFKNLINKSFSKNHLIIFGVNKLDLVKGNYFNTMLAVNNKLEIIDDYNKIKLVPFGEFLPFEKFLNKFGFKKITEGYGSYSKGYENENIIIGKANILPLICYEIIFTDFIQKSDSNTNLIINISEDGWFGKTIGPDQHFAKAIFRSIENNTFVLRSANKGISAIIDNKGNIIKQLDRFEAGSIEFEVPLINSNKNKNDLIFFIVLITYLLIFLYNKKKNEKK
tara:strand:+ start:1543 stop:3105 length:1563 start_codon:yes stop_codon:yes gene_type:complete